MGFSLKKIGKGIKQAATGNWVGLAGTVAGGLLGSSGSKKAAGAQVAGQQQGIDTLNANYAQTRSDFQPYTTAGTAALNRLTDPNAFTAGPGYGFARSEALDAVKTQGNALGRLASGNTLAALEDRASGLASQEYDNWFNQQQGIAGMGLNATGNVASFGANTAGSVANLLAGQGGARAEGIAGSTNALTDALGRVTGIVQNGTATNDPLSEYDLTAMNKRKMGGRNLLAYGG